MSEIKNATITREANVYFDGQVVSRTVILEDGSRQTLGIIQPGEYMFDTAAREIIEILSGQAEVKLADGTQLSLKEGESFEVPANSDFNIRAVTLVDYCCSYITE